MPNTSTATSLQIPTSQPALYDSLRAALLTAQQKPRVPFNLHTIEHFEISTLVFLDDGRQRKPLEDEFGHLRLPWDQDLGKLIIIATPGQPISSPGTRPTRKMTIKCMPTTTYERERSHRDLWDETF